MTFLEQSMAPTHATWRLNRPERGNGLGLTLARAMLKAVHDIRDSSHKPRALVITAAPVVKGSQRTWVAGGDLKELAELHSREDAHHYVTLLSDLLTALDDLPLPVIMAIDGAAIGGGAELALGGDLRLATAASTLEFRQLKIGLATGYGSARRLVELVGLSRAQGMLYRTECLSAQRALDMGLIHSVCDGEQALQDDITDVCEELVKLDPQALATQKRMLWHAVRSHPNSARTAELELFSVLWRNPSHASFLERFLHKSKAAPSGQEPKALV